MAKPSSAKTRRRTHNNHNNRKVRRTQTRRGGVPKDPNAYDNPYHRPPSTSHMVSTFSRGGPKATRDNDMKRLDKRLFRLATDLEFEGTEPVDIANQVNQARQHGLAIIDHNYPRTSSIFGSSLARMSGIFKRPRNVVYPIAELTPPHPDRHENMSELVKDLNINGIAQLKDVFTHNLRDITKITKKPNGDIFIHYSNSHPLLGDRASMMIPAGK